MRKPKACWTGLRSAENGSRGVGSAGGSEGGLRQAKHQGPGHGHAGIDVLEHRVRGAPDDLRRSTLMRTDLLPPDLEVVRLVEITGLDLQADGGTQVACTRQIGRIEVAKIENKGLGFRRDRVRLG